MNSMVPAGPASRHRGMARCDFGDPPVPLWASALVKAFSAPMAVSRQLTISMGTWEGLTPYWAR